MNVRSFPIPAVVLDWAGTTVDHGCLAPVAALQTVFARRGLPLSAAEARVGMGLPKKDHLRALLASKGNSASGLDELYAELETEIFAQLERHGDVIVGTTQFVDWLRTREIQIGTTTGYTHAMMKFVRAAAARQGYTPDLVVTPDDVATGRPTPLMIYANAVRLGVWPLWSLVKIGDTPTDIAEGRNAGTWTIGVAATGNAMGLSAAVLAALTVEARGARADAARESLEAAQADFVVDSVADCPAVLEEIAGRLCAGERPRP